MCSFIITPSILLHMLHILHGMCEQPGGNQSGKTWSVDLGDAAQWSAALQTERQCFSQEWRVGGWMGKRHHLKGMWVWICACYSAHECVNVWMVVSVSVLKKPVWRSVLERWRVVQMRDYWQGWTETDWDGGGKEIRESRHTASQTW